MYLFEIFVHTFLHFKQLHISKQIRACVIRLNIPQRLFRGENRIYFYFFNSI